MAAGETEVTAVVLNYNGLQFFDSCLTSLLTQTHKSMKVLLVDNGSTDASVAHVRAAYPEVKILETGSNLGYALGNNLGALNTDSPLVIFVNNDAELEPTAVQRLRDAIASKPEIVACQPKILNRESRHVFDYAGGSGGFIDFFGYPFCRGRIFQELEVDSGQYNDTTQVFWASGAALMVKRGPFLDVGGFDDGFFLQMEEIDFCWRARLMGWEVWVVPDAIACHSGGGTLRQFSPRKTLYNVRNNLVMLVKNLSLSRLTFVLPSRFALDALALLHFAMQGEWGQVRSFAMGYVGLLSMLRRALQSRHGIQARRHIAEREILSLTYPGSIALSYFLGRVRTFGDLKWNGAKNTAKVL